jgi:hypothetical protein
MKNPHVIDYAAMGRTTKPRMLHRPDCTHNPEAVYRKATKAERASLPECASCARREAQR